jgi:hypothetical protein
VLALNALQHWNCGQWPDLTLGQSAQVCRLPHRALPLRLRQGNSAAGLLLYGKVRYAVALGDRAMRRVSEGTSNAPFVRFPAIGRKFRRIDAIVSSKLNHSKKDESRSQRTCAIRLHNSRQSPNARMLRRARRANVAAHLDNWANSPGLQPLD